MAVTQVSSLNSLFNLIQDRARFTARHRSLMVNLVQVVNAQGWMDRKIATRPTVSAVQVAETEDFNSPTTFGRTALATLTPQEVIAQVVLTDRALTTDPDGARMDAEMEMGGAIGTKVDTDLVGLFSSFDSDKGDGAGNTFTMANFAAGVAVVDFNKARQFGALSACLHPYHWHDLWTELGTPAATYTNLQDVTSEALRDYYVDRLLNVNIYTNGNIAIDASDDAVSGIFGARAIMLDVRKPITVEPERDASARAWELNASMGYAYGVVHSNEGVYLTADATEPA